MQRSTAVKINKNDRASKEKVLSLLQPWASLVITGAKKIETRSWSTAHRGILYIHASSSKKAKVLAKEPPFNKYLADFDQLPFGAIIGYVQLEDVVPIETLLFSSEKMNALTLEEKAFGDYGVGRYAWLLSEPVPLEEPIPVKGSLRLWECRM